MDGFTIESDGEDSVMAENNVKIDYSTAPGVLEDVSIDYSSAPDQDTVPPVEGLVIDYATAPGQEELPPQDVLQSSLRGVPIPQLGGIKVGQVQDLAKADEDTQKFIKAAMKYPYELFTGQLTSEQFKESSELDFDTLVKEGLPKSAASSSVTTQFALNITAEMMEWGTRPSSWLALSAMHRFNKPLAMAIGETMKTRFPKTHAFWTKQRMQGVVARAQTKLEQGLPLTPEEAKASQAAYEKAADIAQREMQRERVAGALGQRIRKDPTLRAREQRMRGFGSAKDPVKFLPAPEQTLKTPLSNNPVVVYDSRVGGPLELQNLVVDAAGKPITLGMDELGVVVESAELGVETIPVTVEPEIVSALKAITEKINEYTSLGKTVPGSLLKRQEAVMGALEVPGKSGANIPASKIIGVVPPEKIVSTEAQLLKDRFRNLARGYREGRRTVVGQMKENMKLVKQIVRDSSLEDKTKILGRLTDMSKLAKPGPLFKEVVLELQAKIAKLEVVQEKQVLKNLISKELKRAKPVKQGTKRVAKYDYENNKVLEELRRITGLTKSNAQTELNAMPIKDLSKVDIIKTRVLSFAANGAASSLELRTQLLEDIRMLKELGKKVKSEEDFQEELERQERVEEFDKAVAGIKGGDWMARFIEAYAKGVANIGSAINATAGGKMSRKYDPEIKQLDMVTATFETETEMIDGAIERLGLNNRWEFRQKLTELQKTDIEIVDTKGSQEKISKMQLLDIYNAIKYPLFKERYDALYSMEQVNPLIYEHLNDAEMAFGDFLMESLKDYYPAYNAHYIATTGRDLPQREPYWPGTSESTAEIFDEMRRNGETPSAEKALAKSAKVLPRPTDAWAKALYHMKVGEHVRHLSPAYEELKRLISDRAIRLSITEKFGAEVYENIKKKVEVISLASYGETLDDVSKGMNRLVSNWTGAKISVPNVTSPLKQLASVINYADKMPAGEWASGFGKGVRGGKATWDYMWERAPWLKARFKRGYAENVARAIQDTMRLPGTDMSWAEAGSILVRMGDVGAIVYGGFPYVKWLQTPEGGGMTEAEAFEEFKWSVKGQQSPLSSGLSDFQNSRHWGNRALFNFKNTVSQYLRKGVDSVLNYINGEIPKEQMVKTLSIYWLANAALIAMLGRGVHEGIETAGELIRGEDYTPDVGELMTDIALQIAISPTAAIPGIEDVISYALRWAIKQKKPHKVFSMSFLDDVESAIRGLSKVNPTFTDYIKALGVGVETAVGLNTRTWLRYHEIFEGKRRKESSVASLKKRLKR